NEEGKICKASNPFDQSPINQIFTFYSSVLSHNGKEQIGGENEQSAHHQAILRSSTSRPMTQSMTMLEDGIWIEEQSKDTKLQKETKQAERMKKSKPSDRQVHLVSHRMERTKLAREKSSWRITEWFRDAMLDRPKLETLRMQKGYGNDQRADRRAQLTSPSDSS
ncbi:hypothetical protein H5410_027202, partial [Solanum commersonii]